MLFISNILVASILGAAVSASPVDLVQRNEGTDVSWLSDEALLNTSCPTTSMSIRFWLFDFGNRQKFIDIDLEMRDSSMNSILYLVSWKGH